MEINETKTTAEEIKPFDGNVNIKDVDGLVETITSAPTGVANKFFRQFKIFNSLLYFYDSVAGSWQTQGGSNSKIGFGTRSESGDVDYNCGFAPANVIIFAWLDGTNTPFSIGTDVNRCYYRLLAGSNWNQSNDNTKMIYLPSGTDQIYATYDTGAPAGSFRLAWYSTGLEAKFFYIALR